MTTNLGGEKRSDGLGFSPEGHREQTDGELRKHFTPEFLGRLDKVVHFGELNGETMEKIVRKYLGQLQQRAAATGVQLQFPDELAVHLGSDSKCRGGARQIRRLVQEQVEGPLSVFLLKNGRKITRIKSRLENGVLHFQC